MLSSLCGVAVICCRYGDFCLLLVFKSFGGLAGCLIGWCVGFLVRWFVTRSVSWSMFSVVFCMCISVCSLTTLGITRGDRERTREDCQ